MCVSNDRRVGVHVNDLTNTANRLMYESFKTNSTDYILLRRGVYNLPGGYKCAKRKNFNNVKSKCAVICYRIIKIKRKISSSILMRSYKVINDGI